MKFLDWVEWPRIAYCVSKSESGFVCEKYKGGSKVREDALEFGSVDELERFLLSIPETPKKPIADLIERLKGLSF